MNDKDPCQSFPPMGAIVFVRLRPGTDEFDRVRICGMASQEGKREGENFVDDSYWWTETGFSVRAYAMRDEGITWVRTLPKPLKQEEHYPNLFANARRTMAYAFATDPGLSDAYRSNVAMLLCDRYNITDHQTRNRAAKDILDLIFGDSNGT